MAKKRVVLAYSGGLDTSVAIPWIKERYDAEVITLTAELGQGRDMEEIRQKALKTGAEKSIVIDLQEPFIERFVWPALRAGTIYENQYPLATALARPLIAESLVEVAIEEGAGYVAHGCTGKGNDQVRFDVSVAALAPELHVIAPAREWGMSRDQEMEYAAQHDVPVPNTKANPYSVDENLWGRSIEAGTLEDPWNEPPEGVYLITKSVADAPELSVYLEIEFAHGTPIAINGENLSGLAIVNHINTLAGEHGVGRIDHLENRLVGIKSREIYEAPAGVVLHDAHHALETLTLGKEQMRFKELVAQQYADLVYNGLWFSRHREDLDAYVDSTQEFVSGTVRVKLHKGSCSVVGRKSPHALYDYGLATYDESDQFDHQASVGFIKVFGLPVRTQARRQARHS
ncbi:MAG: argininosuccinate synthase [Chloroflexota bacterium]|nr:argininosuccinate synthase [Chloroflexota bacterium]